VVTGGDDHVVRTWIVEDDAGEKKTQQWKTTKIFELKDHTAPITALSEHPSEPWICSSGKDGSCKIWNIKTGILLLDIPFLIDGIKGFDPNKMKMECRGCW
jgi:WD40 repeat protein